MYLVMRNKLFNDCCLLLLLLVSMALGDVQVRDVSVKPHYPWNGLVDITYSILCGETDDKGEPVDIFVTFEGYDAVLDKSFPMRNLTGPGATAPVKTGGGPYTVTWNAVKDYPTLNSSHFQIRILASSTMYLVVDLSGGPDATHYPVRYSGKGPNLDNDTCRTTELWLRRIPAGKFLMGSIETELGRIDNETLHEVTISKDFYIGVFECTQRQYELIMGNNPSRFKSSDGIRPVESVSYNMIRGTSTTAGAGWPKHGHEVDASSFMGKLQGKTGLMFDFPTEAQWEYACRAGTDTPYNSGGNGRYKGNVNDGRGGYSTNHTKVGSYPPNDWGLYDMHGNVWEWCLDWYGTYKVDEEYKNDPVGADIGSNRVMRSGSWSNDADFCRSAYRNRLSPPECNINDDGFRIACHFE